MGLEIHWNQFRINRLFELKCNCILQQLYMIFFISRDKLLNPMNQLRNLLKAIAR